MENYILELLENGRRKKRRRGKKKFRKKRKRYRIDVEEWKSEGKAHRRIEEVNRIKAKRKNRIQTWKNGKFLRNY